MKKSIVVISSVLVAIALLLFSFRHTDLVRGACELAFGGPPSPHSDVPIVYTLGWWAYQEYLTVDSVKSQAVHSQLSLFNSHSLIRYIISGHLSNRGGHFRPTISEVHASERYLGTHTGKMPWSDSTSHPYIGEITLTPIVTEKEDVSYNGESLPFRVSVEEIIQSAGWGSAIYIVRCGDLTDTLSLFQYK